MNRMPRTARPRAAIRLGCAMLLVAWLVGWVGGCGGSVGGEGTGNGYTSGPISGFGSIIVGGIHFDDASARIENEDGDAVSRDQLRLGATVEVDSGPIVAAAGGSSAEAERIRVVTALLGTVASNDPPAGRLVVFGQTVRTTSATTVDERLPGGIAAIVAGDVVRVYGLLDPTTGVVTATRIEPDDGDGGYRIRGVARAVDSATATFRIGAEAFSYAAAGAPEGLRNGAIVRVRVDTRRDAAGRWVVLSSSTAVRVPDDDTEAQVEGRIDGQRDDRHFTVEGLQVDASNARFEPSIAAIAEGVRVEVEGTMQDGVLVAAQVKVEDEESEEEFEISGSISSVDTGTQTFVVRGTVIGYDADTRFEGGDEGDLEAGRRVEVEGTLVDGGTRVRADKIAFE